MNYDYSKSGFGLSRRKKYSKINEEIRYRPTYIDSTETIEWFHLDEITYHSFP